MRSGIRERKGLIQGSVVALRNADAAILAEVGGRQVYGDRQTLYSDLNRVTGSLRQRARRGSRSCTWPRSGRV